MTTQTEALKLALKALEIEEAQTHYPSRPLVKAITAIKEALAQPEQDKERCVGCEACIDTACGRDECPKGWPKAAQPEQQSNEHLESVAHRILRKTLDGEWKTDERYWVDGPPSSKLIAYVATLEGWRIEYAYTTSPQRTWVGLTDEEGEQ